MRRDLSDVEIRVVGCLVEKQRTTPDGYPLTFNSLRLACNQATNRSPVTEYDEATVREALGALGRRRWIRSASAQGSRVAKYRHLLAEELPLPDPELAILTVLMLRGAQTPGELKQRADRMHSFASVPPVLEALEALIGRELVRQIPRRPGQKEERYEQLLAADRDDVPEAVPSPEDPAPSEASADGPPAAPGEGERVGEAADEALLLRQELDALAERVRRIEERLDRS